MNRARRTGGFGFTLVELMIALALGTILMAIAVPSYRQSVAKQRVASGQSDLAALALNLDGQLLNNAAYPAAPIDTTAALRTALPGWAPVATGDFGYALTAADSASFPPSYTITATGTSSLTSGCQLRLTSAGARTKSGCAGGGTSW